MIVSGINSLNLWLIKRLIDGRGVFNRMSRNSIRDCFAFALLESLCDWS